MDIERILSANPNILPSSSLHKAVRKERSVETEQAIDSQMGGKERREQGTEQNKKEQKTQATYDETATVREEIPTEGINLLA